jgi:hypothetical protein
VNILRFAICKTSKTQAYFQVFGFPERMANKSGACPVKDQFSTSSTAWFRSPKLCRLTYLVLSSAAAICDHRRISCADRIVACTSLALWKQVRCKHKIASCGLDSAQQSGTQLATIARPVMLMASSASSARKTA